MTTDTTYQGWPTWSTWNVVLWARNDEPSYRWWVRQGETARTRGATVDDLARTLQEQLPQNVHNADMQPEDYADVDWKAVAAACLEDAS